MPVALGRDPHETSGPVTFLTTTWWHSRGQKVKGIDLFDQQYVTTDEVLRYVKIVGDCWGRIHFDSLGFQLIHALQDTITDAVIEDPSEDDRQQNR